MDLTEFVTARLDEDEAAAKAATPGPWVVGTLTDEAGEHYGSHVAAMGDEKRMLLSMSTGYVRSKHVTTAEHVARHDPARVLREVAAKRAILAEHAATDWTAYGDRMCRRCVLDDDEPHDELHHWLPFPCPTVRALAAVYSGHPDYDPAWAPPG